MLHQLPRLADGCAASAPLEHIPDDGADDDEQNDADQNDGNYDTKCAVASEWIVVTMVTVKFVSQI
jgi:hypothetical protein